MVQDRPVVLAQKNYLQHRNYLEAMKTLEERFVYIYQHNLWGGEESRSGLGSSLNETEVLRKEVPIVLAKISASSILDIPCGDFRWMSTVNLSDVDYVGADIVENIVVGNRERFASDRRHFVRLDLTRDVLPRADLVLCRDCLVHLSYMNIAAAMANIKKSSAKWLLATHFLRIDSNSDIHDGDWRPLSLTRPPFNLPAPHLVIVENCMEAGGAYSDKVLGLWRVADLPQSLSSVSGNP